MKKVYNSVIGVWRNVEDTAVSNTEKKESNFQGIPTNYKELQELARRLGIPANQKKAILIKEINDTIN